LKHAAAQEFKSELTRVPLLTEASVAVFRGRRIRDGQPSRDQMGPPPHGATLATGRYNKSGQCVLYLCDNEGGVRRELRSGTDPLYIIPFTLPASTLRIADFTSFPIDHFLTAAFAQAELCEFDHRRQDGYRFSNILAELVAEQVDGMKVRGARGEDNEHYNNIVVFQPHPAWRQWLDPDVVPYLSVS
jgi:hypothetical protein